MADSVLDWESIIHKNVRSKDYDDAGNVDAVNADAVIITSQGDRKEEHNAAICFRFPCPAFLIHNYRTKIYRKV